MYWIEFSCGLTTYYHLNHFIAKRIYIKNAWYNIKAMALSLFEIHCILTTTFSITGMFMCLLLVYLIIKNTPIEMKPLSRVLLQGCAVDFIGTVSILISEPIIAVENGSAYIIPNSIFAQESFHMRFGLCIVWIYGFTLMIPCIPTQFIYRYLVLVKDYNHLKYYPLFILIPAVIVLLYTVLCFFTFYPRNEDLIAANIEIKYLIEFTNNGNNILIGIRAYIDRLMTKIVLAVVFTIMSISYGIAIWCSIKIRNYFNETKQFTLGKTRKGQLEISKALVCQALSPLLTMLLPLIYIFIAMFWNLTLAYTTVLFTIFFSLFPIISCSLTIYFVKPYRMAVLQKIFRVKHDINSTPSNFTKIENNNYKLSQNLNAAVFFVKTKERAKIIITRK